MSFSIKNKEKLSSMCQKILDDRISDNYIDSQSKFVKTLLDDMNLSELNFNSIEQFNSIFSLLFERGLENIKEELHSYNKDDVLFCLIKVASYLSRISMIKLNGEFNYNTKDMKKFPKLTKRIETNKQNEIDKKLLLNKINSNVGVYKKGTDILINLVLKMKTSNNDKKLNKFKLNNLILNTSQLWNFYMYSKLSHDDESINYTNVFIKNYEIHSPQSKERFIESSVNYAFQDFNSILDDKAFETLCEKYEKKLKYSPKMLIRYLKYIKSEELPSIFSISELEEYCNPNTLPIEGFNNLFNDLVLKPNSTIFGDNNRTSIKGIIQIANDQYVFDENLFVQYILILSKKLENPNFSQNKNIQKYINKKVTEKWLLDFQKKVNDKKVWCEINQNVSNEIVNDGIKDVTKEIDLLLYNRIDNILMVVEYKNWEKNAYNINDEDKESNKIKKHVNMRLNLIKLLEKQKDIFLKERSNRFDKLPKIELFFIFKERNVLCNLKQEEKEKIKINYYSVNDFEEYIFSNISNFQ